MRCAARPACPWVRPGPRHGGGRRTGGGGASACRQADRAIAGAIAATAARAFATFPPAGRPKAQFLFQRVQVELDHVSELALQAKSGTLHANCIAWSVSPPKLIVSYPARRLMATRSVVAMDWSADPCECRSARSPLLLLARPHARRARRSGGRTSTTLASQRGRGTGKGHWCQALRRSHPAAD